MALAISSGLAAGVPSSRRERSSDNSASNERRFGNKQPMPAGRGGVAEALGQPAQGRGVGYSYVGQQGREASEQTEKQQRRRIIGRPPLGVHRPSKDVDDSLGKLMHSQHSARAAGNASRDDKPVKARTADLDYDEEARKLWSRLDSNDSAGTSAIAPTAGAGRNARRPRSQEPASRASMELRQLWKLLNLDPSSVTGDPYSSLDPLWRNPKSGGTFFVGNQMAASNLAMLREHGITHVVNCTDNMPNYHEDVAKANITYFRFDITSHYRRVQTEEQAVMFVQPMLNFVERALAKGANVMVHCLAGAHRAGTTGVLCLMHFAHLPVCEAIPIAKRCRPIIDPIGGFPQLLALVERGWQQQKQGAVHPSRKL
jgi:hypothetical protein